jgi:hypothetical protein
LLLDDNFESHPQESPWPQGEVPVMARYWRVGFKRSAIMTVGERGAMERNSALKTKTFPILEDPVSMLASLEGETVILRPPLRFLKMLQAEVSSLVMDLPCGGPIDGVSIKLKEIPDSRNRT